jgi:outer membrane protein OmpA-like peptidoglycan-associated protein
MIGFVVKYSNKPSTITARKGDTWMLVNVGSETYNVSLVAGPSEFWTPVKNADEISREIKAHGRVDIYGIEFSPTDQSIQESTSDILPEIVKYLKANPNVPMVIESHKISALGAPETDSEITRERANAVMDWLIAHGIARSRLQPRACGRDNPLADNESPAGAQRNERIVLVKANS